LEDNFDLIISKALDDEATESTEKKIGKSGEDGWK